MNRWFRRLLALVLMLLSANVAGVAYLTLMQKRIVYRPSPGAPYATPKDYDTSFESIEIRSTDDVTLKGWWIPSSASQPPEITLVYYQGNAGGLGERARVAALFSRLGWNVVMATYRGYGESTPHDVSEMGMYADARAMLNWAREKTPSAKYVIWGHSLGSSIAAWISAHEAVDAVILEDPFTSIIDMAEVTYPWLFIPETVVTEKFETARSVANRTMPLLVLVAADDRTIPPLLGREVFRVAQAPKTLVEMSGVNHDNLPDFFDSYAEFLRQWVAAAIEDPQKLPHFVPLHPPL